MPPAVELQPVPGQGADVLPEISWWAVNQSFVEDKGAVVLSGSAWVRVYSIKLEADHIIYFRQTRELYAEGHIRLREGESEFSAEVAYVDVANDRGYLLDAAVHVSRTAEGTQNLNLANRTSGDAFSAAIAGETPLVSTRDPYGIYLLPSDDPQGRIHFIFKAKKLVRHSRLHYVADEAFLTNDEMARPLYGIKLSQLELLLRDKPDPDNPGRTYMKPQMIIGRGARIKVGPIVLPPLPTIRYDLTRHQTFFRTDLGRSSRWGHFGLFRIGWGLGGERSKLFDPTRLYLDADYRWRRGPALGAEFRYQTGRRPEEPEARNVFERGRGKIQVYAINEFATPDDSDEDRALDNLQRRFSGKIDGNPRRRYDANRLFQTRRARDGAGSPSAALDLYAEETRYMLDVQHHQPLLRAAHIDNLELDFKYQRQSDRDFMLEYFPQNYYAGNQPEALLSARKSGDNFTAELLYRTSPQEFDGSPPRSPVDYGTFTDYEPAVSVNLYQSRLPGGFYATAEGQAARMRREFERKVIDQDTYEAGRLYGRFHLERPFRFAGFNWRPWLGWEGAAYDNSRSGGEDLFQWAPKYGIDISTRLYGEFPGVRNEELNVHGLRHVIEPRLEYIAVDNTSEDPRDVLDFDEKDDLIGTHRLRLSLDQLFYAGTKAGHNAPVGGLSLWLDIYPRESDSKRLLGGDSQDPFHANGFINVHRVIQFRGDVGIGLEQKVVETAYWSLVVDPGGRWRVELAEHFNYNDNDRAIQGTDVFRIKLDLQLSERWGLSTSLTTQRKEGFLIQEGTQAWDLVLARRYGPLVAHFKYSFDRGINDSTFDFSIAPALAYRNVVVPMDNLVVPATDVDEAPEAPEERNFDPFGLTGKSKKKPKPGSDSNAPPPPSRSPAPAPPPEDAGGATPVPPPESGQRTTPAKQKPENLDNDDWSRG